LLRYAARVLGGSDSAEAARDVVQETWIGAIRGLRGLRDPAQFRAWIYGIATRKCADVIRATTRRRQLDAEAVANCLHQWSIRQPSNKSTWRPRFGDCRRFIVPLSTCSTLRS
jgi:DNA-directed RNA polymerase specialized sigma24 family protein